MTPLEWALWYIRQGLRIFPVWGLDANGACRCGGRPRCKPGKHPATPHGHLDATTDPDQVAAWWRKWPDAAVAVALAASGLADVAPDSLAWLREFGARGLPPTATFQSSNEPGHVHFLYRRPPNCTTARICRTAEFDLMASGFAILPNGHGSRAWVGDEVPDLSHLPDAPGWVAEMLVEQAVPRTPTGQEVPRVAQATEPPMLLSPSALAVWRGERPKRKPDGTVDRSASLLLVGRVLYDAGLRSWALVQALAERDRALYRKFTDRADASTRYAALVAELTHSTHDAQSACVGSNNAEPVEHPALSERQAEHAALRNPALSPGHRVLGAAVARMVSRARAQGRVDANGAVAVYGEALAQESGLPSRTARRLLADLEQYGWLERALGWVRQEAPNGPVPVGAYKRQLRILLPFPTAAAALHALSTLHPPTNARTRAARAKAASPRAPRTPAYTPSPLRLVHPAHTPEGVRGVAQRQTGAGG